MSRPRPNGVPRQSRLTTTATLSVSASRLRAPVYNPYDKFTQPQFDAWIDDITGTLRRALGHLGDRQNAPPANNIELAVEASVESDTDAEMQTRRALDKGKGRDPREGPGLGARGKGSLEEPIDLGSDSEDDEDEVSRMSLLDQPELDSEAESESEAEAESEAAEAEEDEFDEEEQAEQGFLSDIPEEQEDELSADDTLAGPSHPVQYAVKDTASWNGIDDSTMQYNEGSYDEESSYDEEGEVAWPHFPERQQFTSQDLYDIDQDDDDQDAVQGNNQEELDENLEDHNVSSSPILHYHSQSPDFPDPSALHEISRDLLDSSPLVGYEDDEGSYDASEAGESVVEPETSVESELQVEEQSTTVLETQPSESDIIALDLDSDNANEDDAADASFELDVEAGPEDEPIADDTHDVEMVVDADSDEEEAEYDEDEAEEDESVEEDESGDEHEDLFGDNLSAEDAVHAEDEDITTTLEQNELGVNREPTPELLRHSSDTSDNDATLAVVRPTISVDEAAENSCHDIALQDQVSLLREESVEEVTLAEMTLSIVDDTPGTLTEEASVHAEAFPAVDEEPRRLPTIEEVLSVALSSTVDFSAALDDMGTHMDVRSPVTLDVDPLSAHSALIIIDEKPPPIAENLEVVTTTTEQITQVPPPPDGDDVLNVPGAESEQQSIEDDTLMDDREDEPPAVDTSIVTDETPKVEEVQMVDEIQSIPQEDTLILRQPATVENLITVEESLAAQEAIVVKQSPVINSSIVEERTESSTIDPVISQETEFPTIEESAIDTVSVIEEPLDWEPVAQDGVMVADVPVVDSISVQLDDIVTDAPVADDHALDVDASVTMEGGDEEEIPELSAPHREDEDVVTTVVEDTSFHEPRRSIPNHEQEPVIEEVDSQDAEGGSNVDDDSFLEFSIVIEAPTPLIQHAPFDLPVETDGPAPFVVEAPHSGFPTEESLVEQDTEDGMVLDLPSELAPSHGDVWVPSAPFETVEEPEVISAALQTSMRSQSIDADNDQIDALQYNTGLLDPRSPQLMTTPSQDSQAVSPKELPHSLAVQLQEEVFDGAPSDTTSQERANSARQEPPFVVEVETVDSNHSVDAPIVKSTPLPIDTEPDIVPSLGGIQPSFDGSSQDAELSAPEEGLVDARLVDDMPTTNVSVSEEDTSNEQLTSHPLKPTDVAFQRTSPDREVSSLPTPPQEFPDQTQVTVAHHDLLLPAHETLATLDYGQGIFLGNLPLYMEEVQGNGPPSMFGGTDDEVPVKVSASEAGSVRVEEMVEADTVPAAHGLRQHGNDKVSRSEEPGSWYRSSVRRSHSPLFTPPVSHALGSGSATAVIEPKQESATPLAPKKHKLKTQLTPIQTTQGKSCGSCTYLNDSDATRCSVCHTRLNRGTQPSSRCSSLGRSAGTYPEDPSDPEEVKPKIKQKRKTPAKNETNGTAKRKRSQVTSTESAIKDKGKQKDVSGSAAGPSQLNPKRKKSLPNHMRLTHNRASSIVSNATDGSDSTVPASTPTKPSGSSLQQSQSRPSSYWPSSLLHGNTHAQPRRHQHHLPTGPSGPLGGSSYYSSPVTRSNCRYRRISLPLKETGPRIYLLVPGCTLGDAELMEDEEIVDHGDATVEESTRVVRDIESLDFDAYLIGVIRQLVGLDLLREQEVYYLPQVGEEPMLYQRKRRASNAAPESPRVKASFSTLGVMSPVKRNPTIAAEDDEYEDEDISSSEPEHVDDDDDYTENGHPAKRPKVVIGDAKALPAPSTSMMPPLMVYPTQPVEEIKLDVKPTPKKNTKMRRRLDKDVLEYKPTMDDVDEHANHGEEETPPRKKAKKRARPSGVEVGEPLLKKLKQEDTAA